MSETHLKVEISPLDDPAFHAAVDEGIALVRSGPTPLASPIAAGIAEEHLRAAGFADASVRWREAPDDTMGQKAIWIVRRDG
jgi:hypothetical protein